MIGKLSPRVLAALLALVAGNEVCAATPEEERVLGSDGAAQQFASYLPYTRSLGAEGIVSGTLAESTAAAGVPAAAMVGALDAFATTIDLDRDVHQGDRFYVRYEQMFTLAGAPVGAGRVLWAELHLAGGKRTVAIYRFQPKKGDEQFWTNDGQGTETPPIRLPLDVVAVSSGFGMRVDPFDQPARRGMGIGPLHTPAPPKASPLLQNVNVATPLGKSLGLSTNAYVGALKGFSTRSHSGSLAMHEGVDLVAPVGTPLYAAADGVVKGAEPKGRYGNWVEIEHAGRLATVYGHLSAFAPGIEPGAEVHQGDVIGYVGTTGRTTGPHVHFELLVNGHPTNPIVHPAVRHAHLAGADLVAFRKLMASDQAERALEAKTR